MKAIVKTRMAPGAELLDVETPEPKADEVLVKVKATSICGTDVHIYNWDSAAQVYIRKVPQIQGHEFAGEVVEIGKKVRRFKVGDYVSAETHFFCGKCAQCKNGQKHICETEKGRIFGLSCDGCFAEYVVVPEKILWRNNPNLPPEIATLQEPLGNAVYCALGDYDKDLNGKAVLILGDGPIAMLASGVCKAEGACLVVLVGRHQRRLEISQEMGADIVINERENDVVEYLSRENPDEDLMWCWKWPGARRQETWPSNWLEMAAEFRSLVLIPTHLQLRIPVDMSEAPRRFFPSLAA